MPITEAELTELEREMNTSGFGNSMLSVEDARKLIAAIRELQQSVSVPSEALVKASEIRTAKRRDKIERGNVFYETAEECAKAAAPLFARYRWRWKHRGIPNEHDILTTLKWLQASVDQMPPNSERYSSTGRLTYFEGRFGHERPPE